MAHMPRNQLLDTNQPTKMGGRLAQRPHQGKGMVSSIRKCSVDSVWKEGGKVSNYRFSSTVSLPTFSIDLHQEEFEWNIYQWRETHQ